MKVVVVDDDPDMLEIYKKKFAKIEASFDYFLSPIAGLNAILCNKYDLIITDLKMPHKSGQELITFLRKVVYDHIVPIIVISGFVDDEVKQSLSEFKSIKIFSKPAPWPDLIPYIKQTLNVE